MKHVTNQRSRTLYSALAALALAAGGAAAQTYPDKPVKIISPFSAGGPADIYARFLGQRLEKRSGQPFVVENRAGGGGIIGTDAVAKAPPDGYTLLLMSNTHTVNESLVPKKPFQLMTRLRAGRADQLLRPAAGRAPVGAGEEPARSCSRSRSANPGKLNYASSGPGTPYHMAGELFKSMAGRGHRARAAQGAARARAPSVHGRPGRDDVRRDHHDGAASWRPGKVRALATSGQTRSAVHARRADGVGSRRARLRRGDLARHHGAGRHAEADRRPAERRDPEGARAARRRRRTSPSRARCRCR